MEYYVEPRTFREAMQGKRWKDAMGSEFWAMEENQTWIVKDLRIGKKAIESKWVYKLKYHSDGTPDDIKQGL